MDRILALAELCLPQHVAAADRSLIGSIGVDGIGEAFERWIGDAAYRFTETEFMRLSELVREGFWGIIVSYLCILVCI